MMTLMNGKELLRISNDSPTSMVRIPTIIVATLKVKRTVPIASFAGRPAPLHIDAMSVAIADRNMRPTSCT